jgi:hypothetical protein
MSAIATEFFQALVGATHMRFHVVLALDGIEAER